MDASGRQQYSLAFKRRLAKLALEPGVSVAGIALAHRINANQLFGLEIDNNAAERSLRPVRQEEAGSDAGDERAAALYTLIGTDNLNGRDPEAYLRAVLEQIAEHPINWVGELLPRNLATAGCPIAPSS